MKTLVLIGLLAMTAVVVAPTAAAHLVVVSFPDPATGNCKSIVVPHVDNAHSDGVGLFDCRVRHALP